MPLVGRCWIQYFHRPRHFCWHSFQLSPTKLSSLLCHYPNSSINYQNLGIIQDSTFPQSTFSKWRHVQECSWLEEPVQEHRGTCDWSICWTGASNQESVDFTTRCHHHTGGNLKDTMDVQPMGTNGHMDKILWGYFPKHLQLPQSTHLYLLKLN